MDWHRTSQPQPFDEGMDPSFDDPGDDILFQAVPIFIGVVVVIVIGGFVVLALKGLAQWMHNNRQPVLRVDATLVRKRIDERRRRRRRREDDLFSDEIDVYKDYILTFEEEETGQRHVFDVNQRTYDEYFEGDRGTLVRQGTRFHDFELRKKRRDDSYRSAS